MLVLGLAMTAQSALFYESLARIPLGIAVAIEFLGPLAVALATSRRPADLLCILLAGVGILLLTPVVGSSLDPVGVLLALGAAAGWAGFILASRRLGRSLESGVGMALAMALSGLLLLPIPGIRALVNAASSPTTLLSILGVAMFSAAIPLLFEFLALKSMPTRKYGVLVSLEPVVATLVGILLLATTIDLRAWIAIVLITLASIGVSLLGRADPIADPRAELPVDMPSWGTWRGPCSYPPSRLGNGRGADRAGPSGAPALLAHGGWARLLEVGRGGHGSIGVTRQPGVTVPISADPVRGRRPDARIEARGPSRQGRQ